MKRYLIVLSTLTLFILTSCGAGRMVKIDPYVGAWTLVTKDTPQGDINSTMTIVMDENEGYKGTVVSDLGTFQLQNVAIVDGRISAGFNIEGTEFDLTGTFSGDNFNGRVSSMDGDWVTTGTRAVAPAY